MPHEVIMPVLGMNQDTGSIACWHKQVGDYVNEGDVLMDIETDKAVTEIEAKQSGYLSQIHYQAGCDVPVGTTVALIDSEPSLEDNESASVPSIQLDKKRQDEKINGVNNDSGADKVDITSKTNDAHHEAAVIPIRDKGVLSSPKARMLASQHGLSMDSVAQFSKQSVLHAKDVIAYVQSNEAAQAQALQAMPANEQAAITFRVMSKGLRECQTWLWEQQKGDRNIGHVIATLAVGLLRQHQLLGSDKPLAIQVDGWKDNAFQSSSFQEPGQLRFSCLDIQQESLDDYQLHVLYLGDSPITEISYTNTSRPTLIVSEDNDYYSIKVLGISGGQLSPLTRFCQDLAVAMAQPLLHLA